MFGQWQLNNDTIYVFIIIIFLYLIIQPIFGNIFRQFDEFCFDSYIFTISQLAANISIRCRVVPYLINK